MTVDELLNLVYKNGGRNDETAISANVVMAMIGNDLRVMSTCIRLELLKNVGGYIILTDAGLDRIQRNRNDMS